VLYSVIRVGVFAVALALLLLLPIPWWVAAVAAAIIGLCVSYIFFGELRGRVAADLVARRGAPAADADADVEDR
jgi:hypothetical protein